MTRTGIPGRSRILSKDHRVNQALRRNGKIQSCEPCRKRKLRCDHILPTCGRCARRNRSDQCIYHPAPLTKAKSSSNGTGPIGNETSGPGHESPLNATEENLISSATASSDLYLSANGSPRRRSPVRTDPKVSHGFLGPTSYSAIFSENQNTIDLGSDLNGSLLTDRNSVTRDRICKGAEVLLLLNNSALISKFIDRWFAICEGLTIPEGIMKQWVSEMYSVHKKAIKSNDVNQLEELSEKIWNNTLKPLTFDKDISPAEWARLSSGANLRWEVVALVLTHAALLCLSLLDLDPIFTSQVGLHFNRQDFVRKVGEAAETCLSFCREMENINDLFVCALFERGFLVSRIKDRLSYASWQSFGELMSAVVMMGYHQETSEDEKTPWFLVQLRRIIFIFSFATDKSLSAFLGRPPRLSQKYCLLQVPIDLDDREILLEGHELQNAIARVSESGWSTSGRFTRATSARLHAMNACIKEDILELSLGVSCENLEERAILIQEKSDHNWRNLPSYLRREDDHLWDNKACAMQPSITTFLRIEYLNQGFLIQRTLVRRVGKDTNKLREYAQKMFHNTMVCVHNRESFMDTQLDFALIMHTFGLPSAAVLAVELLRQEQGLIATAPLHRSNVIQELSVFAACLGSMRLEGTVQSVCEQGKRFLKKILDTILSPNELQGSRVQERTTDTAQENFRTTPELFSLSDGEFMSWLDSLNIDPMLTIPFNP